MTDKKYIVLAEALKAFPEARADMFENCRNCTCLDSEQITMILQGVKAADVRPVARGRWIATVGKKSRICSACGHDEPYKFADNDVDIFNYCPNCGADMREAPNDT